MIDDGGDPLREEGPPPIPLPPAPGATRHGKNVLSIYVYKCISTLIYFFRYLNLFLGIWLISEIHLLENFIRILKYFFIITKIRFYKQRVYVSDSNAVVSVTQIRVVFRFYIFISIFISLLLPMLLFSLSSFFLLFYSQYITPFMFLPLLLLLLL